MGVLGRKVWEIVIDCFHIHNTSRDYQIRNFSRGVALKCVHKSPINY